MTMRKLLHPGSSCSTVALCARVLGAGIIITVVAGASAASGQAGGKITYNGTVYSSPAAACTALLRDSAPTERLKQADPPDEYGNIHCVGQDKKGETGYDQYMNGVHFDRDEAPAKAEEQEPVASPAGQPATGQPSPEQPPAGCVGNTTDPRVRNKPARNPGTLPIMIYDYNRMPEISVGIWHAQQAGWPSILTYDATGGTGTLERRRCMSQKRTTNIDKSGVIRSKVSSADEYPFASTVENQGSTYISNVPKPEQDIQGGTVNAFYTANRAVEVSRVRPFYFEVRVINLPDSVTTTGKSGRTTR